MSTPSIVCDVCDADLEALIGHLVESQPEEAATALLEHLSLPGHEIQENP